MQKTLVTAEQLLVLDALDRDTFHELVDGELVAVAPSNPLSSAVSSSVNRLIGNHVSERGLGVVTGEQGGYKLRSNPDTVRAPDVAFVSKERLAAVRSEGFAELAPDLVAEVVSPSDSAEHLQQRARMWLEAGVRLVIVVYPESRMVAVYQDLRAARLYRPGDRFTLEPVLPDLELSVDEFFRGLPTSQR